MDSFLKNHGYPDWAFSEDKKTVYNMVTGESIKLPRRATFPGILKLLINYHHDKEVVAIKKQISILQG